MRAIDLHHLGRERVVCAWQVDGVVIDCGPGSTADRLLAALGDDRPRALLLTHIHLDHAGAAGALVRRWPDLEVWVHERGARHVIDPSRLIASARRLWPDLDERWGESLPVPEANVHLLSGGETVAGFAVAYTPGHASHHVSFLHGDSGHAFVGDVAGVRVGEGAYTLMPTPPPDIDVDAWQASLETVAAWEPTALGIAHYGLHQDVGATLASAREELARWAERARVLDAGAFQAEFEAELDARVTDPEAHAVYAQASPTELEYSGLERYWAKRERRG